MTTPQDSFHSLQEDWRLEIEEMFDELRIREKVTMFYMELNYDSASRPYNSILILLNP
jgi:hypothetical protein